MTRLQYRGDSAGAARSLEVAADAPHGPVGAAALHSPSAAPAGHEAAPATAQEVSPPPVPPAAQQGLISHLIGRLVAIETLETCIRRRLIAIIMQ